MLEGGAARIADKISVLKDNRNLPGKRETSRAYKDEFICSESHSDLKLKEATDAVKQRIWHQAETDSKRQSRKEISMLILAILLFIAAFGWFTRYFI